MIALASWRTIHSEVCCSFDCRNTSCSTTCYHAEPFRYRNRLPSRSEILRTWTCFDGQSKQDVQSLRFVPNVLAGLFFDKSAMGLAIGADMWPRRRRPVIRAIRGQFCRLAFCSAGLARTSRRCRRTMLAIVHLVQSGLRPTSLGWFRVFSKWQASVSFLKHQLTIVTTAVYTTDHILGGFYLAARITLTSVDTGHDRRSTPFIP